MKLKQITHWLDPILLIGLFISIAIGVVMVESGNDTLSGLIIGFLSTIITLLIDAIARIHKAEASFREAAGLMRLFSDEAAGSALRDIAKVYEEIARYDFDHYHKIADATIDECLTRLREVASGAVNVLSRSPQAYGMAGFYQAQRNIKVIHVGSMQLWTSDFGRKYFDLNKATAKRGVQITRIFALTPEQVKNSIEVLKEQEKAGIRVLVVRPDRVDHEFMIYDDRILVDFDIDDKGEYRREKIVLDPAGVKKMSEQFQQLVDRYAKNIKDSISTT